MSAKGLPPAVRLDPLIPLTFPASPPTLHSFHHNHHHHQPLYSSYECAKQARPPQSSIPVSSLCIEAPMSGSGIAKTQTPPISSPNDHEGGGRSQIANPRDLTPIIITPSSSRAHTPVSSQLLPLPPSLCRPPSTSSESSNTTNCCSGTLGKGKPKKIRIEPRIEPVDLKPLLPTKREATPRVMAVFDDEIQNRCDGERDGRPRRDGEHVRQDREDENSNNRQLPTPHTTPPTQALDTPDKTAKGGKPVFQFTTPYTGKIVNSPAILFDDGIHPMSLDEPCPLEREGRENEVERGRKRERGPSRFRDERRLHHHHRPGPYDTKSRPLTIKSSQTCPQTKRAKFGKEIDGVAAILLAAGMDVDLSISRGRDGRELPCTSEINAGSVCTKKFPSHPDLVSSATHPTSTTPVSPPSPPTSSRHQPLTKTMSLPAATPPRNDQSPPSTNTFQLPPFSIHASADEMIHLFTTELEFQISREREKLEGHFALERQQLLAEIHHERQWLENARTDMQRERDDLQRSRNELEREREMMLRERQKMKAEFENDIRAVREENERLRSKVGQLERSGALGSGVNGPGHRT